MAQRRRELAGSPVDSKMAALLARLGGFLSQRGVKSYLIGGYVRDSLMGQASADIDIAVTGKAPEIAREVAVAFGGKFVLLDAANEVARVVLPQEEDRLCLDFSTLRGKIEEDLALRDFTINAIALDLEGLGDDFSAVKVIDIFGGQRDLEQGIVRAVSQEVFDQDAARLLRAARLAAELGFTIDSATEALIRHRSHLVATVAGERVQEELYRLLDPPQAASSLRYLDDLGLLSAVIPELAPSRKATQPKEHYWDVFDHSIETVAAVELVLRANGWQHQRDKILAVAPWSPALAQHFGQVIGSGHTRKTLLKLAALLHDIAKPQTKFVDEGGRIRFFGHAQEGAAMARHVLERLRFSAKETKTVETVIRHHLRPMQMSDNGMPSRRAIYRYFRDTDEEGIDTLFLSLADHLATRGPQLDLAQWEQHAEIVQYVLTERFREEGVVFPPRLITGHDLIAVFGMSPGPGIGELLEVVREAQAAGEIASSEEALSFVRRRLSSSSRLLA